MPRYIYTIGTITSTGQPQRLQFYDRATGGSRLTDLYTIDGSDNLIDAIPSGVVTTSALGVVADSFAGPDEASPIYMSVNGSSSRTTITAVRPSHVQGDLTGNYARLFTTPAASTTLTGTVVAGVVTSVDCTAGAGARTLPAASSVVAGASVLVKKSDTSTNALVITRAGSDLIFGTGSGSTTKTLTLAGEAVELVSNGVDRWTVTGSDTPSGVLATTYAGMARSRPGNLAVFWGDSLTQGSDTATAHGECWPVYLTLISGQKIRYLFNAGVAGQASTAVLARFTADVAAYSPTIVFVLDGTNDIGTATDDTAFATWKANKAAQVALIRGIRATPVLLTIPPNSGGTPINRKQEIIRWNAWLRRYAQANGIDLVDTYALVCDPATGGWLSAYLGDGTHWNAAGLLAVATLINTTIIPKLPLTNSPLLCVDAIDENNLMSNGIFSGVTGSSLPTGWVDSAGTPTGSVISYTTDASVPGKLFTITSTASSSLRQFQRSYNFFSTTMPATSAGATNFSLSGNPFSLGTLFIGTPGSTNYEIAKVSSVSGGGPYSVTVTRALRYAHTAGEPVVGNAAVGDTLAFSGLVTSDGGATFRARLDLSPSGAIRPLDLISQPVTRGIWYQELVLPSGTTGASINLDVSAGTSVISFGQIGLYNVTRMGA